MHHKTVKKNNQKQTIKNSASLLEMTVRIPCPHYYPRPPPQTSQIIHSHI